jgi:hypothetical protein
MAKRAVLMDSDNREVVAHLTYSEMDAYIQRGLVMRLTPVKAKTHKFRLLGADERVSGQKVFDLLEFDQCSLTAAISRANAGVSLSIRSVLWAQRHVRAWPSVGDTRAVRVSCRRPARRKNRAHQSAVKAVSDAPQSRLLVESILPRSVAPA